MKTQNWKVFGLEIAAVLCGTVGLIGVADFWLRNFGAFFIGPLPLFLIPAVLLWRKARSNQPPLGHPNWKQWTVIALGVVALLATCAYPPYVKMTQAAAPGLDLPLGNVTNLEFFGWHGLFSLHTDRLDDGSWIRYDFALGTIELEWFAVGSITAIAFLLLRTRNNAGSGALDAAVIESSNVSPQTGLTTAASG
jgi:hypothetical protein